MTPNVSFQHVPERAYQPSRRHFLKRLAGGVAAAGRGSVVGFSGDRKTLDALAQQACRRAPGGVADEDFWRLVKDQFPLRPGLILMNAANLCPSPYPVAEAVVHYTRDVDADASFQNRGKFTDLHEAALEALARYMGADADEVVITRNTSEGNNLVVAGLDLGAGDEVVLWDQNHPSNNVAWDVRAQRHGFAVRRVATPADPQTPDDLLEPFAGAITANTRVLSFSHVSNVSGVDLGEAFTTLYERHHVGCAVMRGDLSGLRLCPHVYNTMDEVEQVVEVVKGLA